MVVKNARNNKKSPQQGEIFYAKPIDKSVMVCYIGIVNKSKKGVYNDI